MTNNVAAIKQFGQKIWLDNISRKFLVSGDLTKLIQEDGICGLTSNPAIFYKAISSDPQYQDQLKQLKNSGLNLLKRYEKIVIEDIKEACRIMLPLYQNSNAEDGYVSLEVAPDLAHDAKGTVKNALELWEGVNSPNLMIKVPATAAGVSAFEELIIKGINVNITLLFSLSQVNAIWDAYIRGLTYRINHNLAVDKIKAVASFFISRIDTAVDDQLPIHLQGKTAINLARQAYLNYQKIFQQKGFSQLRAAGAKGQYLLWASTGTKNKNYSDVLYVEQLIGAETINTIPDATLDAFRDHGCAKNNLIKDIQNSGTILKEITECGINLDKLGEKLQEDGLALFSEAFTKLLDLVR